VDLASRSSGSVRDISPLGTLLLGGLTGALTGIVPGIGGFTANFMAYGIAKQTSRHPERFGTEFLKGSSHQREHRSRRGRNDDADPRPRNPRCVGGALFLAALSIKAYEPVTDYDNIPGCSLSNCLDHRSSGLIGTVAGVLLGPQLARITRVPGHSSSHSSSPFPLSAPF